jgi:hypothetical protein
VGWSQHLTDADLKARGHQGLPPMFVVCETVHPHLDGCKTEGLVGKATAMNDCRYWIERHRLWSAGPGLQPLRRQRTTL